MEICAFVTIFVHFCAIWISLVNLKPVPDFEDYPEGCVHSEQASNPMRARRSIPDSDNVNPAYLETEAEPQLNQEELSDPGRDNDISQFALSDPMSEFFRSHKDKDIEKTPVKQGPGDRPANWVKEDELVRREALSADEQIDCYKQQNIDPPGSLDEPQGPLLRLKDQRPFSSVFQNNQRIMSRPLMYKERGMQKMRDRVEEANEITSLYSDPEKRQKLKKQKSNTRPKNNNALDQLSDRSVYKPVGVRPEFPVYDEDIDFHPDPLQGILEDKYWLDPQEQEAVIRKYIDLASNMQPPSVDYSKREALRREFIPKSVDSKEAFINAEAVDRECPCRDLAACGDCSKGKWRKNNSSEREDGALVYGSYGNRKLLSISDDETLKENRGGDTGNEIKDVHVESDNTRYIFQGKKDKYEKDRLNDFDNVVELGVKNEETQVEGEVPSYTSNYFGRKLLSFEDDETTKEYYGEEEDTENTEYDTSEDFQNQIDLQSTFKSESTDEHENGLDKSKNRRSIPFYGGMNIKSESINESYGSSPLFFKLSNNSVYEFKLETEKIGNKNKDSKLNDAKEFMQMQKPFLVKPNNFARYYVPNKFGNLFQKTLIRQREQESSSTINPDLEFAIDRNETFLNVSVVMNDINVSVTTEIASLVRNNKVRREQPTVLGGKGRRSYQLPLMKHPHVKTLQGADDSGNTNVQIGNNTVNANSSTSPTLPTAISSNGTADNATDINSNTTDNTAGITTETATTVNTTENGTTKGSTTLKPKKKIEDYDEDSFDAEVANDIVETVIAESQSGSVVGHNLGLCRRNDSVSKYAKVSPESEQLLKKVTECILDRIRDRLEGQSCTLLDDELLQFLKWMVLSGESYKDYLARIKPEYGEFKSQVHAEVPEPPSVNVPTQVPVTAKQTS